MIAYMCKCGGVIELSKPVLSDRVSAKCLRCGMEYLQVQRTTASNVTKAPNEAQEGETK